MKKTLLLALPLVGAMMFSGCATTLGGGNQQTLSISSSKPLKGQMKYSDGSGLQHFTTPATLSVDRKNKDIILTSKDGQFEATTVKSETNPWLFGNVIFGTTAPLSSTTDFVGGAAWRYQEVVNVSEK